MVDAGADKLIRAWEGTPWQGVHASENWHGTWTLGSWTGVRMPLNTGCHRYADRGTAARFGNDPG